VDPVSALLSEEAVGGYSVVIVGPLLSLQWAQFVPSVPRTTFVLVDVAAPPGEAPSNAVFLTFDRTEAFRDAGRAAAQSVRGAAPTGTPVSDLGSQIGGLVAERTGLTPAESEAFAAGVAEVLGGARPAVRSLPLLPDPQAVRAAIEKARSEGVAVFLLGLGERDPVGLQALHDFGGSAVVSDWQGSGPFADQVLVSVDEDVPGGIAQALTAARSGASTVAGPVRLVRGVRGRKI